MLKLQALLALSFAVVLGFAAEAKSSSEAELVLYITGDSGSTVAKLNASLKKKGEELLPKFIVLTSKMTSQQISDKNADLRSLANIAEQYEGIESSAYGNEVEGNKSCFRGNNEKVADIYTKMVDSFVSDQFTIMAVSTKNPDHVGIKFDESDSGSDGSWINIERCEE